MRPVPKMFAWLIFFGLVFVTHAAFSAPQERSQEELATTTNLAEKTTDRSDLAINISKPSRIQVLIGSLTIFTLAVIVGFEIIAKVPPTLHTPLMSGSNAISGITVVGALIAAGNHQGGFASFLGLLAVILANINVVGGFWVTHRMLLMFKKK